MLAVVGGGGEKEVEGESEVEGDWRGRRRSWRARGRRTGCVALDLSLTHSAALVVLGAASAKAVEAGADGLALDAALEREEAGVDLDARDDASLVELLDLGVAVSVGLTRAGKEGGWR